jgi:hypothetical protein
MYFFDSIEKRVMDGLNQVCKDAINEGWSNDTTKWTQQIKDRLCTIGLDLGFEVCTQKSAAPKANWGEWLYDMTWLEYDRRGKEGYLIDIPLVLECEWLKGDKILDDFEKIIIAKAKNKVIICQKANIDEINNMFKEFKGRISLFRRSEASDRYLFAGLNCSENNFEFESFMPFRS